jgi:putative endonuclease
MERNKNYKQSIGKIGEEAAARHLVNNGIEIIERNFRAGRLGEIDIIAVDKEFLCFVEVKARTGSTFGCPSEAINNVKQQNLKRLALSYVKQKGLKERQLRFDVAEVFGDMVNGSFVPGRINIIKNAF